jgi:hypothetical protein
VQHPCFTGFASLVSFVLGSGRSGDVDRNFLFTGDKRKQRSQYIAMSMCNSFKCAGSAYAVKLSSFSEGTDSLLAFLFSLVALQKIIAYRLTIQVSSAMFF